MRVCKLTGRDAGVPAEDATRREADTLDNVAISAALRHDAWIYCHHSLTSSHAVTVLDRRMK
jgi:hypothetical protein